MINEIILNTWISVIIIILLGVLGYLIGYIYDNYGQSKEQIKFILTSDKALSPERGTKKSAGYDLKSCENITIPARSHKAIKTGVQVRLPLDTYGRIASRSGLSFKNGIEVGAGVVDEDYRNELMVILHNHSDNDFKVEEGSRIAQLIVERVVYPTTLIEDQGGNIKVTTDSCIRLIRGLGGFGSTGTK
jgi:dUTP pyrophosphatase